MIISIFCVLVGGCISFIIARKQDKISKVIITFLGMFIGAFCSIILFGIFSATISHTSERIEKDRVQLVALIGSDEIQGSFFLVSGSIGSEQYYKYYYQTADGGKKFGKISAEGVTVYEEDRQDAYIVRVGTRDKYSSRVYFWLFPRFLQAESLGVYTIHVPKGTIKAEYKLDLK
jgi:hypothetical protein